MKLDSGIRLMTKNERHNLDVSEEIQAKAGIPEQYRLMCLSPITCLLYIEWFMDTYDGGHA